MPNQSGLEGEAFAAFATSVGPLPRVDALVPDEVGVAGEPFFALVAGERLLAGVHAVVG